MDWMIVEPSLEARLRLECSCRGIKEGTDLAQLQNLCIALMQQNFYQGLMLRQAVNHIASKEPSLMAGG
tara:strand:- start:16100 stop:16306 length:207 start_codon:yes stop_codon:yes gene_type:complete